ncbi:MAG: transcription termination factor NusA [Parcubacteria group bacterium]|jgi:N utilization substance protein A
MAKQKKLKKTDQTDESQTGRLGQFGSAIAQIAEEKGIDKKKVIEAIESALAAAYKKDYGRRGQHIRAQFDEITGGADFFLVKEVVDETTRVFEPEEEEMDAEEQAKKTMPAETHKDQAEDEEKIPRYNPERDLTFEEAKKTKSDVKVGDIIEEKMESKSDYGRVAAQTAKQVIVQKIREAERDSMYDEYKQKEGEILSGVIQRIEGRNIFIDLGKSTGILFPSEQVEGERYRLGQRLKIYLMKVESDPKGPGIILSRSHPALVQKLFEIEVPEIFAGTVEIKAMAREAGSRTKIAVSSNEDGIDPIGSCVGQKGTRVQAVIDELGGEKIDIIEWNEDLAKFISNALSPAKVLHVELEEARQEARVMVPADQLSLAIGKQGQNVRLAAKLTGWRIDVVTGDEKDEEAEKEKPVEEDPSAEKTTSEEKPAKKNEAKKEKKKTDKKKSKEVKEVKEKSE